MFRLPLDPNQGNNFTTQLSKALVIKERWHLAKLSIKCEEIRQAVSDMQGQQIFTCHQTSSDSGWMMWKKEKKEEQGEEAEGLLKKEEDDDDAGHSEQENQ